MKIMFFTFAVSLGLALSCEGQVVSPPGATKPVYSGPGVRVSGRVTDLSGIAGANRPRTVTLVRVQTAPPAAGTFVDPLEADIQSDGRFEFERVPEGPYSVTISPRLRPQPPVRLEVRKKDLRDITIVIPFYLEIKGRVVMAGSAPLPAGISIEAKQPRSTIAEGVKLDGTFTLTLTEGKYQISVSKIPQGYAAQSITHGSLDMRAESLIIDRSTAAAPPMIVTITPSTQRQGRVFKVSGRVTGGNQPVAGLPIRLALAGNGVQPPNVLVQADGSFEFPEVGPGNYALLRAGPALQGVPLRLTVTDRDVKGVHLALPLEVQVTGKISVIDINGNPLDVPPTLRIAFTDSASATTTTTHINITSSNEFHARLAAGKYSIKVLNLPAGHDVKSILAGAKDVKNEKNTLDAKALTTTFSIILVRR